MVKAAKKETWEEFSRTKIENDTKGNQKLSFKVLKSIKEEKNKQQKNN